MAIDLALAQKVLDTVDAGLVHGLGKQEPGKMCVEAAVCFALGLPHGDDPPCVGSAVRRAKISLNDARWSSNEERTKGLRRLAVAQLGSNEIDQRAFATVLARLTIERVIPRALRAAAGMEGNKAHREALEAAAVRCESKGTREAAEGARSAANANAYAANAAAYAANAAAANADADANADANARDKELHHFASIFLLALRECGSPGVALLDEIEAATA